MTVTSYIENIEDAIKKEAFLKLRNTILEHIPFGFEETINYNMIGYVVPLKTYPKGYHCTANTPLPFINIAVQKNFIALYHMGIYANADLHQWFVNEYPKHVKTKLDMGKSCIRFKNYQQIPYELIAMLVAKMTPEVWITCYTNNFVK